MAQHSVHARNDMVQVERFRLQKLLAPIRQELPCQRGGSIGGFADFACVSGKRITRGKVGEYQFTLANDRGQDAVELVSHSTRQLADCFHFLCLKQLIFKLSALDKLPKLAADYGERA